MGFYKTKRTFANAETELKPETVTSCQGLNISTDLANDREFKITAQLDGNIWSVDQKKMMEKIR